MSFRKWMLLLTGVVFDDAVLGIFVAFLSHFKRLFDPDIFGRSLPEVSIYGGKSGRLYVDDVFSIDLERHENGLAVLVAFLDHRLLDLELRQRDDIGIGFCAKIVDDFRFDDFESSFQFDRGTRFIDQVLIGSQAVRNIGAGSSAECLFFLGEHLDLCDHGDHEHFVGGIQSERFGLPVFLLNADQFRRLNRFRSGTALRVKTGHTGETGEARQQQNDTKVLHIGIVWVHPRLLRCVMVKRKCGVDSFI